MYRATCEGVTYSLEPFIEGDWRKVNSNDGTILEETTEDAAKLNALSHWTIQYTGGHAAILDMQGSYLPNNFI